MSNSNTTEHPDVRLRKDKGWLSFLAKLVFIVCAFFVIVITVLANMGGSNDMLKKGVADFASSLFGGRPATVDHLINMKFFPSLGFDAEGIHVLPFKDASENVVNIGKLKAYSSFWNIIRGYGRFRVIYAENIEIKEGVWGERSFNADEVVISHDRQAGIAELRSKGKLGVYDWNIAAGLDIFGGPGSYSYVFGKEIPFTFNIADIHIKGRIVGREDQYAGIKDFDLTVKDTHFTGDLAASLQGEKTIALKGTLKEDNPKSTVDFDVTLSHAPSGNIKIAGSLSLKDIEQSQLWGDATLVKLLGRMIEVISFNNLPHPLETLYDLARHFDYNLTVSLENLKTTGDGADALSFHIKKTPNYAEISKISGTLDTRALDIPDLFITPSENGAYIMVDEGKLNLGVLSWLSGAKAAQKGEKDIQCALASVTPLKDKTGYGLDGLKLRTQNGVQETGKTVPPLILAPKTYDFISQALLAKAKQRPCLSWLPPAPPKEEPKEAPKEAPKEESSEKDGKKDTP